MTQIVDRRELLRESAKIAAGLAAIRAARAEAAPASAAPAALVRKAAPSEKVIVAVMGVRGRGRGLARTFAGLPDAEVACLCDVDANVIPSAAKDVAAAQRREPRIESDFRRILEDRSIDALVIATPDHWHAPAAVMAMQAGKDVYVEKPVSHNVREGRIMIRAAERHGRVVQCGTQSRSGAHCRRAVEFLRSGKLGKVLLGKAVNSQRRANIGKAKDGPAPDGVDYDLWLGPAPKRPFNPNRFHYNWHWHWDYGTGDMGNDGVHWIDLARWGMGVAAPVAVSASAAKLYFDDDQQTPDTQMVTLEYPGSFLVFEQRIWAPYHEHGYENATIFYCENGYLILAADGWKAFGPNDEPGPSEGGSEREAAHAQNFVDCIRTRGRTNAPIEEGHYSALACHLGNIAGRVGRRLVFDPETERIAGDREAGRLLRRDYRAPFLVPDQP